MWSSEWSEPNVQSEQEASYAVCTLLTHKEINKNNIFNFIVIYMDEVILDL